MERVARVRSYGWLPDATERLTRAFGGNALALILSWLVLGLVILLSLFVLYMTFVPGLPTQPGFTLSHWASVASPYMLTKVLPNTLIVGVGSVLVATFFGCPLAWLLNRTSLPWRQTFITLIAASVIVPGFVKAMGWLMLVNERIGLINKAAGGLLGLETIPVNVNNVVGAAWLMGLMLTPTMFFLIAGPMQALDPTLEEAAGVARASRLRTLLAVSLPLVWPGIFGGAIY